MGDDVSPNIRSRLVARLIRTAGQDAILAPTPPLESLRKIPSMATTKFGPGTSFPERRKPCWDAHSDARTQVMLIDIRQAYFNARTDDTDPIYVDLPLEADTAPVMCALLRRRMYGTRRAPGG